MHAVEHTESLHQKHGSSHSGTSTRTLTTWPFHMIMIGMHSGVDWSIACIGPHTSMAIVQGCSCM
jgi:hypothetical protein